MTNDQDTNFKSSGVFHRVKRSPKTKRRNLSFAKSLVNFQTLGHTRSRSAGKQTEEKLCFT